MDTSKGKWTGIIISFLVILWFSQQSHAESFGYIDLLRVNHDRPPNMLWNQREEGYHDDESLHAYGLSLGAGIKHNNWLTTKAGYFNLGKYNTNALASENEDCVTANGKNAPFVCDGGKSPNTYITMGAVQGLSLTETVSVKNFFIELGPTYVRRDFSLIMHNTDWNFTTTIINNHHTGFGYMGGTGLKYKSYSVGAYIYSDNVGSRFLFSSGTGKSYVVSVGRTF